MGKQIDIITKMHKRTQRDYIGRMADDKINCMEKAREYGFDYWDGDRRFGYGGYRYDGRWKTVAEEMISIYGLTDSSKVLDIGCGKAFILYEIKQLLPGCEIVGVDISDYGIQNAKEEIRDSLFRHDAAKPLPFGDNEFDLAFSITTLHNLKIYDLKTALKEMDRVGRQGFLTVEAYRNSAELFNLECWALTCEAFFRPDEWVWLFNEFGYRGDYEFIYFE